MIIGIGTDIVFIPRIGRILRGYCNTSDNWRDCAFNRRIFNATELALLQSIAHKDLSNHIAKRFALKEATAKAFGCGFGSHLGWRDITITNDDNGRPIIEITDSARIRLALFLAIDIAQSTGIAIHASLADDHEYAVGYVIIDKA